MSKDWKEETIGQLEKTMSGRWIPINEGTYSELSFGFQGIGPAYGYYAKEVFQRHGLDPNLLEVTHGHKVGGTDAITLKAKTSDIEILKNSIAKSSGKPGDEITGAKGKEERGLPPEQREQA